MKSSGETVTVRGRDACLAVRLTVLPFHVLLYCYGKIESNILSRQEKVGPSANKG